MGFSAICFSHKELLTRILFEKVKEQCSSPLSMTFYNILNKFVFQHYEAKVKVTVVVVNVLPSHCRLIFI